MKYLGLLVITLCCVASCKKEQPIEDFNTLKEEALKTSANTVIVTSYEELALHTSLFKSDVETFIATPTANYLELLRTDWLVTRQVWEKTESWLFGPVATLNIDPRIDTWPVDFVALDSVMTNNVVFDESLMNGLDDALKGFHPIEYLIWGKNGNKTVQDFTAKDYLYLKALVINLNNLCAELSHAWITNAYNNQLILAGNGSTEFNSRRAAYVQLAEAMAGICDEVANGKIAEPFLLQAPEMEESPFAKNSIADFKNNMNGVLHMYQGSFITDSRGMDDIVKYKNTQLNLEILGAQQNALAALNAITVPFGEAILTQPVQVQHAIDAINELKIVLDSKLIPYLQQYAD